MADVDDVSLLLLLLVVCCDDCLLLITGEMLSTSVVDGEPGNESTLLLLSSTLLPVTAAFDTWWNADLLIFSMLLLRIEWLFDLLMAGGTAVWDGGLPVTAGRLLAWDFWWWWWFKLCCSEWMREVSGCVMWPCPSINRGLIFKLKLKLGLVVRCCCWDWLTDDAGGGKAGSKWDPVVGKDDV